MLRCEKSGEYKSPNKKTKSKLEDIDLENVDVSLGCVI